MHSLALSQLAEVSAPLAKSHTAVPLHRKLQRLAHEQPVPVQPQPPPSQVACASASVPAVTVRSSTRANRHGARPDMTGV